MAQLLSAGVVGLCLAGFLNATRVEEYEPVTAEWAERPALEEGAASPARRYAELEIQPWRSGPEAGWGVDALSLAERASAPLASEVLEVDRSNGPLTREAVTERARLRAFDGAPPTVPHPVRQRSASECLACHARGLAIGAAVARPLSHPIYASCTQCHVVSASPVPAAEPSRAAQARNGFEGLASPARGERAWPGAPPEIPHPTWMRQECGSCHGASARAGLHTTHPERRSCTQCHAPSAVLDQRVAGASRPGASR
jgi:cytochrome c-type protein NapB